MDLKTFLLIAILSMLVLCTTFIQVMSLIKEEDEEKNIEQQLSQINKPSTKSFKTDYGIFDCIDIYKQRAFDNPILKDHQIQMWPSHLPRQNEPSKNKFGNFMHNFETGIDCPDGTVPIRRTIKEDLFRWNSSLVQPQDFDPFNKNNKLNNFALVKFKKVDQPYTLASGLLSCHNPKVKAGERSGVQVWMYGENDHGTNYVSAGWTVDPDMYGDDVLHFTIFWKGDGNTGCANMQCPGFVLTSKDDPPGYPLKYVSTPEQQVFWAIQIFRDNKTGHWWLALHFDGEFKPIGYWPNKLFSQLGKGSTAIAFGGMTKKAKPSATVPPMGTGIADCTTKHTAYIWDIQYRLGLDKMVILPSWKDAEIKVDCPDVYKVQNDECKTQYQTFNFRFGGPGGSLC